MSLPPFDPATGLLPAGEHGASWHDILDRFGWNATRRRQLDGLADALALLAAAGCTRVWLNGSFVTAKDEPGDFDAVWDPTGVDTDVLDEVFSNSTTSDSTRSRCSAANSSRTGPNVAVA